MLTLVKFEIISLNKLYDKNLVSYSFSNDLELNKFTIT